MNAKARIATLALATMLIGSNAWADRQQYDYAKVISADPIVNYVNVTTPVRECWEETEYFTVDHNRQDRRAGTFLGAVIGGVIGHQVGSGRGNDAATVAGTLIGAAIGNDAARNDYDVERRSRPVKRCETRYREHREERIDGYRVLYRYHGQKYVTEMPYDPGKRLRVRVDIRPAG